jgi:hypothetical protein
LSHYDFAVGKAVAWPGTAVAVDVAPVGWADAAAEAALPGAAGELVVAAAGATGAAWQELAGPADVPVGFADVKAASQGDAVTAVAVSVALAAVALPDAVGSVVAPADFVGASARAWSGIAEASDVALPGLADGKGALPQELVTADAVPARCWVSREFAADWAVWAVHLAIHVVAGYATAPEG